MTGLSFHFNFSNYFALNDRKTVILQHFATIRRIYRVGTCRQNGVKIAECPENTGICLFSSAGRAAHS